MTVKELKEILNGCNDDAEIMIKLEDITADIFDSQIFQSNDGKRVTFDLDYGIKDI